MNKFNITDFNKKIDDSASKIDELIDRASKANSVTNLLDQTNAGLIDTLNTLKDIYGDLSILTDQFKQNKSQLADSLSLLNSTSENLIKRMDKLNSELSEKIIQIEEALKSVTLYSKITLYLVIASLVLFVLGIFYYLNVSKFSFF